MHTLRTCISTIVFSEVRFHSGGDPGPQGHWKVWEVHDVSFWRPKTLDVQYRSPDLFLRLYYECRDECTESQQRCGTGTDCSMECVSSRTVCGHHLGTWKVKWGTGDPHFLWDFSANGTDDAGSMWVSDHSEQTLLAQPHSLQSWSGSVPRGSPAANECIHSQANEWERFRARNWC